MFAVEPGCGLKTPELGEGRPRAAIAIVTALPEERDAVSRFLGGGFVRLGMTGDGATRAADAVRSLLGRDPVSFLVGAGVAGALVPSLRAGDVVAATRILDESGEAPAPDSALLARALALGARPATLVTVAAPLTSAAGKSAVASRVGASDAALAAVDMESAAWARAAAGRGVPFLVLRAISDTSGEELPAFLSSCLAADGSVDRAAVARKLLLHPGALSSLLAMRRRVVASSEGLGRFLESFLAAGR